MDQAIAACGGDLRSTIRALIVPRASRRSSAEPKPQLSEANNPPLTPPRRVKKAWQIDRSPSSALRVIVDWAVTRPL